MKSLRYGAPRKEKPGILHGMALFAICRQSCPIMRVNSCFLNPSGNFGRPTSLACPKVAGEPRVGPCVGSVGKFVCIGLNYSDHAKEAGMPVPVEPLVFMKPTSSILSKFMSLQTGDVISTGP